MTNDLDDRRPFSLSSLGALMTQHVTRFKTTTWKGPIDDARHLDLSGLSARPGWYHIRVSVYPTAGMQPPQEATLRRDTGGPGLRLLRGSAPANLSCGSVPADRCNNCGSNLMLLPH
ncbi:hypothetical protein [Alkalilimnicola ehrlichii]|uniref:hypothetical protein n=1 Tax=Alkalilimnicola ehrlichii TaxID=351052 RepID=UPI0011C03847|nr:hypothetical protein [Alkalilimnicola ehrlichii]